jgi:hypothetical protein
VNGELRVDKDKLGRYRTKQVYEPNNVDPAPFVVRLGVVRPERFHDCHRSSGLFRP